MFHFHFLLNIEKWKKENLCQFSFFNENKLHAFCFVFVLCPVPFVIMSKRFLKLNKMAAIESLLDREVVSELVENSHRTFKEISEVLQAEFPNKRGLSVKSLKRYCHMYEIKRWQNVADNEVDEAVKCAVEPAFISFGVVFWQPDNFFAFMFFFGENFATFNVVGLNLYWLARFLVIKWWKAT